MKYAVIKIQGKQHLVSLGQKLIVDRLPEKDKAKLEIKEVLMTIDGDKVAVGQPLVKAASVTVEVVGQVKGEKIRVAKFKAKARYRRVRGHRQQQSELKVVKI